VLFEAADINARDKQQTRELLFRVQVIVGDYNDLVRFLDGAPSDVAIGAVAESLLEPIATLLSLLDRRKIAPRTMQRIEAAGAMIDDTKTHLMALRRAAQRVAVQCAGRDVGGRPRRHALRVTVRGLSTLLDQFNPLATAVERFEFIDAALTLGGIDHPKSPQKLLALIG